MDVVINIDASIDRLKSSLRDVREEARRTKQAIESQPIQITATGSGIVSGGGYVGATSFSGGPAGGGGRYVGARSGIAGGGVQQFGGSASDIAAEAAMFGIAAESRRRFAATGTGMAAQGGFRDSILNRAVRAGIVVGGAVGAARFGRALGNLGSSNLDTQISGIEGIGSIPIFGQAALGISESFAGTSTSEIRDIVAGSNRALDQSQARAAARRQANTAAEFDVSRNDAIAGTTGAARERALAQLGAAEEITGIDQQVAAKELAPGVAEALKRSVRARLQQTLVQIEDATFEASAAVADEIAVSEAGAGGNTRAAARTQLQAQLDRRLREAKRNNPELVPAIEQANAAALGDFDRRNTAEAGLAAGGRADRVASAEIGASVAVLRAKGENLRAEREEFERTSELKIAAAEREAEALKDIDRERSEAAKAEAKALRIEAGGQRAAFEIAIQRQAADASAEARFIRIGTNQGQLSEQVARIGRDTLEAVRAAAGSPELAQARGEVGIAQLERIARQLDEAVAGTQAQVSTRGSFLSAQVGGLNDPNRETVATLKNDIATVLKQIEANTRDAGGAKAG